MGNPLVSICIPTYNRREYLRKAIKSSLNQTYKNIEIVISDHSSTDGTEEMVRGMKDKRIKYSKAERAVPPIDNWNRSVKLSRGEFASFLTDDDLLEPDYIKELLNLIRSKKGVALSRCGLYIINERGDRTGEFDRFPEQEGSKEFIYRRMIGLEMSLLAGYLFRRKDFLKEGGVTSVGFAGALYSDDFLWFRLVLGGKEILATPKKLWSYRKHDAHIGSGIDIRKFSENIPNYQDKLRELAKTRKLEHRILNYINKELPQKMLFDRIKLEMYRARKRSLRDFAVFLFNYSPLILKSFTESPKNWILTLRKAGRLV